MFSKFIRAQWESEELEGVDDEGRQTLEEAAELDHIWGVWEAEEEPTNVPGRWIRQPSRNRDDMRHHVEVHASHREKEWESPSASLIEQDPEVIPDVDIAAHVCRDFFLDEKIPRHESGQGYVRVVEHSVMWKETAADGIGLDTVNKELLAIEFKRTRDARSNYVEKAIAVAQEQYTSLLTGLQAVGQVKGGKVQQKKGLTC